MSKISLTFKAKKKRIKSDQELRNESIKFNEQNKRLITGNHTKFDKNDLKNSELIIKCIEQNQWIKPKQKPPNLEMDTNQSNTNTNATKNGTNNDTNNNNNDDTNNNTNNDNNSNNKSNNDNATNGNSTNDVKMDDITKAAVKVLTNDDDNDDDDDGYVAPIPLTDSTPYLVLYDKKGKSKSNGKSLNKIMMKNMAPGVSEVKDENKKYMLDYLQRPDDPTFDVYDKIPIESYGRAMLLGMGWDPNKSNKTNISNNVQIRPKGLGVGAKLSKDKIDQMYGKKRRRIGEQKASEKYKNFIDNGNGHKNSSESSRIKPPKKKRKTEYGLQLFNKNASNDTVNDDINSNGNSNNKTIKRNNTTVNVNSKHKNESPKITYNNKRKITWASKGLLVRIVNKKYGKYFKKKGIIYDIFSLNKLSIKMDDGRLLNVFEDDICTVIPKNGKYVVILNGKYKNERGMIIQKNRDKEVANVQIQNRLDIIKISYDDICAC